MNEEHKQISVEADGSSEAAPKYSDAAYIPVGSEQPNYIYSPNHSYTAPADAKKNREHSFTLSMVLICLICALLAFLLGVSSTLLFSEKFDGNAEALNLLPAEDAETESESTAIYGDGRASLGIGFGTVSTSAAQYFNIVEGAMVQRVAPGSCAGYAGLRMGDIITAVDASAITDAAALTSAITAHNAGDTVSVTVFRNQEYLVFDITLDEANPISTASGEPCSEPEYSEGSASAEMAAE